MDKICALKCASERELDELLERLRNAKRGDGSPTDGKGRRRRGSDSSDYSEDDESERRKRDRGRGRRGRRRSGDDDDEGAMGRSMPGRKSSRRTGRRAGYGDEDGGDGDDDDDERGGRGRRRRGRDRDGEKPRRKGRDKDDKKDKDEDGEDKDEDDDEQAMKDLMDKDDGMKDDDGKPLEKMWRTNDSMTIHHAPLPEAKYATTVLCFDPSKPRSYWKPSTVTEGTGDPAKLGNDVVLLVNVRPSADDLFKRTRRDGEYKKEKGSAWGRFSENVKDAMNRICSKYRPWAEKTEKKCQKCWNKFEKPCLPCTKKCCPNAYATSESEEEEEGKSPEELAKEEAERKAREEAERRLQEEIQEIQGRAMQEAQGKIQEGFEKGYDEGYSEGYEQGLEACKDELEGRRPPKVSLSPTPSEQGLDGAYGADGFSGDMEPGTPGVGSYDSAGQGGYSRGGPGGTMSGMPGYGAGGRGPGAYGPGAFDMGGRGGRAQCRAPCGEAGR